MDNGALRFIRCESAVLYTVVRESVERMREQEPLASFTFPTTPAAS